MLLEGSLNMTRQPSNERRVLHLEHVAVEFDGNPVLRDVSFSVNAGEAWAILGPNGAGKSTLMKVAAQLLSPQQGQVTTCGLRAPSPAAALARRRAWVPQHPEVGEVYSVLDVVLMGRTPFLPLWGLVDEKDIEAARVALAELDLSSLAERSVQTLSGGELRRVWLARALLQQPQLLLLDEPTAFLDVRHQIEALRVVQARRAAGLGVVAVLHDLNLAARFASHVLLLNEGAVVAAGAIDATLTEENVSALYGWQIVKHDNANLFEPRWPTSTPP
jgi:iron complex transport system ATP-binding protein